MSYVQEHMREQMARHQLEPVEAGDVPMFWLKEPDRYAYAVLVTDLPKIGVCLAGDLLIGPGCGGPALAVGYDLGWFTSRLSEDYLCEKFLREEWSAEQAARDTERRVRDLWEGRHRFPGDRDMIRGWVKLARRFRAGDVWSQDRLRDEMWDALGDLAHDCWPGEGYNAAAAGWLCAVQQRFRELWAARAEEAA